MSKQVYLGVDLGAESGRVMAGSWDGAVMHVEELHRFPNGPTPMAGTLRWDVLRLWAEIQHGLSVAGRRHGGRIVSVGVDSWGVDFTLLSKSGEWLGLPYHYRDPRTEGVMDGLLSRRTRAGIFASTGIQFMPINTLYQWMALHRDHPEIIDAAGRFLMIPDFFHWCLCGSTAVEFTNATTTQFFNPRQRGWARELLADLGLPHGVLGEVVEPGTRLGVLRGEVGEATGLGGIPVVAPATHDTGSAVVASPVADGGGRGGWAYISSGTWSLIGIESREPILTGRAQELNVTNEGGVDGTWRVLKNVTGLWLVQQCRKSFERDGQTRDYERLSREAESAAPLRSLIDPDDGRFLNPPDMPAAMAAYCRETGQPVPQTEGEFVRCALESLALKYASVLDGLAELAGAPIRTVHVFGGGSRNQLLNRLTAAASGRDVVAGPVEATVMGNVFVQARAAGEVAGLTDIRRAVAGASELTHYEPPREREAWEAARERFEALAAWRR